MNHFDYRDGRLYAEDVAVADIATAVGTPFFCYSTATLRRHYEVFARALAPVGARICYAIKANSNIAVIRTLAELGAGGDVVSAGEMQRALAAGIAPSDIVFSGVGKTEAEIIQALNTGIGQFNVESASELDLIATLAAARGLDAPVVLRVNPDVDAKTHDKISTGRKADKFGIDIDDAPALYARAATLTGVQPVGIAVHIGSQLTSLEPFRAAFLRVRELIESLRAAGHDVSRLDLGGGLGIPYIDEEPPSPDDYGVMVAETVGDLGVELTVEPGRLLVGNAGILVTRAIRTKQTTTKRFVIVDAAMNDFIRPTLYDAIHRVTSERQPPADTNLSPAEIVGPVCETGDTLASGANLPQCDDGDLLVIESAGAYGAVMGSTYNTRPLTPEVLVNGDQYCVIRPRQDIEALISLDRMPDWLEHSDTGSSRGVA
jgi:diaminopimelate decarboxylase